MYAVIRTGGKQYKVNPGQIVRLHSIEGEVGSNVEFGEVLTLGGDNPKVGAPLVADAKVTGKILRHGRERKILVYKFKRRQGYEKMRGHRQGYTDVQIGDISAGK
jgi:large subunit ribosomal protein L21